MDRRYVVVTFDVENNRLVSYSCDKEKIDPVIANEFGLDLNLDEFGRDVNDDFARKFGASTLSLLALYQPELKLQLNFIKNK